MQRGACARLLADSDARADSRRMDDSLREAASEADIDRLGFLMDMGASVGAVDYDERTALHQVATTGSISAANALIVARADAMAKDRWGATPVLVALDHSPELAALLVQMCGAELPEECEDATWLSCYKKAAQVRVYDIGLKLKERATTRSENLQLKVSLRHTVGKTYKQLEVSLEELTKTARAVYDCLERQAGPWIRDYGGDAGGDDMTALCDLGEDEQDEADEQESRLFMRMVMRLWSADFAMDGLRDAFLARFDYLAVEQLDHSSRMEAERGALTDLLLADLPVPRELVDTVLDEMEIARMALIEAPEDHQRRARMSTLRSSNGKSNRLSLNLQRNSTAPGLAEQMRYYLSDLGPTFLFASDAFVTHFSNLADSASRHDCLLVSRVADAAAVVETLRSLVGPSSSGRVRLGSVRRLAREIGGGLNIDTLEESIHHAFAILRKRDRRSIASSRSTPKMQRKNTRFSFPAGEEVLSPRMKRLVRELTSRGEIAPVSDDHPVPVPSPPTPSSPSSSSEAANGHSSSSSSSSGPRKETHSNSVRT